MTVNASADGFLDAFVDFNADGDWADEGEHVFTSQPLVAGDNALTLTVPCTATPLSPTIARFRFSSTGGLAATGAASDGEVEDHAVDLLGLDLGDTPEPPYPTTLASNGARHALSSEAILGDAVDAESDAHAAPGAGGDAGDDGVVFTPPLVAGTPATATVTAAGGGVLDAWVDFDGDGSWLGAGEQVFTSRPLAIGPNNLTFDVPPSAWLNGSVYTRCRLSAAGGLAPTGLAPDGEVEDYLVTITGVTDLSITVSDGAATAVPGETISYTIVAGNAGPSNQSGAHVAAPFPDSLTCTWTCAASAGAACGASGSGSIDDSAALAAGATATYTATCAIAPGARGTLETTATITARSASDPSSGTNTATVTAATADPWPDNGSASASTRVTGVLPPQAAAAYAPAFVPFMDGLSTLTVTLTNPAGNEALVDVAFTATLPAGLVVAATPNVVSTCSGSVTATPGAGAITHTGATLEVAATCTVSADVAVDPATAAVGEAVTNVTVTSSNGGAGAPTDATLAIAATTTFTGPTATGSGDATLSFTGGGAGCTFSEVAFVAYGTVPPCPGDYAFPHGLVEFTTRGCTPGAALQLTFTAPQPLPPGTEYWKFGPTSGDPTPTGTRSTQSPTARASASRFRTAPAATTTSLPTAVSPMRAARQSGRRRRRQSRRSTPWDYCCSPPCWAWPAFGCSPSGGPDLGGWSRSAGGSGREDDAGGVTAMAGGGGGLVASWKGMGWQETTRRRPMRPCCGDQGRGLRRRRLTRWAAGDARTPSAG